MPKKFLIAANWKMHPAPFLAGTTPRQEALEPYKPRPDVDVVVFPTFLDLKTCIEAGLTVGAQYAHPEEHGAHTGDVSMAMIAKLGCTYVLCGHSERRSSHHETNEDVAAQVVAALKLGLHPIVCVGETEEERNAGREKDVVKAQVKAVLQCLPLTAYRLSLAYEPVWAIGTGKTATPEDAQQMHAFIRSILSKCHPEPVEGRILYGGSAKAANAEALLKQPDVDGLLVGGASLDPKEFVEIVTIAVKVR